MEKEEPLESRGLLLTNEILNTNKKAISVNLIEG